MAKVLVNGYVVGLVNLKEVSIKKLEQAGFTVVVK